MKYILASSSPRRVELIQKLHLPFEVEKALGEELTTETEPAKYAMSLAREKALEVYNRLSNIPRSAEKDSLFVLGADTIVVHEGQILGKPSDKEDAFEMLSSLSGKTHEVYTGVAFVFDRIDSSEASLITRVSEHDPSILPDSKTVCSETSEPVIVSFFDKTEVTFNELSADEIRAYISTGDPLDKAGAYGIQGDFSIHVSGVKGNFENVIGLPVSKIYEEMKRLNLV
jgi:septum formation protein